MDPFSGPFYGPKFGPPAKSRKRIKTESVVPIFGTRSFTAARLPQPRLYQPTGGEQTLVNQFLVQKWTCFWVPTRRYLSMLYLACCCTKRTYREYSDSNNGRGPSRCHWKLGPVWGPKMGPKGLIKVQQLRAKTTLTGLHGEKDF